MPAIVLQVGQAGNQAGAEFWRVARTGSEGCEAFFDCRAGSAARTPRAVLVDTEPKAISSSSGVVCPEAPRCVLGQGGRCNNWAFGYQAGAVRAATEHGFGEANLDAGSDADAAAVLAACRRHAERLDGVPDFLLMHSLAGGTGSGLGSRVLEQLRDDYRAAYVAAACIAPSASGETTLQSINSTMALSFIQAYADVAFVFNNDDLLAALQAPQGPTAASSRPPSTSSASSSGSSSRAGGLFGGAGGGRAAAGGRSPGLKEMNELVAKRLVGALWPLDGAEVLSGTSRIRDIVQTVAPHPSMKFVEVGCCTARPTTPLPSLWADSLKQLGREFPKYLTLDDRGQPQTVTASSTLLLARNYQEAAIPDPEAAIRAAEAKLFPPPPTLVNPAGGLPNVTFRWMHGSTPAALAGSAFTGSRSRGTGPTHEQAQASHMTKPTASIDTSIRLAPAASPSPPTLTAISNRSSIVPMLDRTVDRCTALCSSGAYMHWYERYGCPKDAIMEAAGAVADVADCYCRNFGLISDC